MGQGALLLLQMMLELLHRPLGLGAGARAHFVIAALAFLPLLGVFLPRAVPNEMPDFSASPTPAVVRWHADRQPFRFKESILK